MTDVLCKESPLSLDTQFREPFKMFSKKHKRGRIKTLAIYSLLIYLLMINTTQATSSDASAITTQSQIATQATSTQDGTFQVPEVTAAATTTTTTTTHNEDSNSTSMDYLQFGRRLNQELQHQHHIQQPILRSSQEKSDTNLPPPISVSSGNSKGAPVLRPSLEEVASELSRKHLNLEHENWRLKHPASSSSSSSSPQVSTTQQVTYPTLNSSTVESVTVTSVVTSSQKQVTVEAEQEIKAPTMTPNSHSNLSTHSLSIDTQQLSANGSSVMLPVQPTDVASSFSDELSVTVAANLLHQHNNQQYLHLEAASSVAANQATLNKKQGRRKKTAASMSTGGPGNEDDRELYLCHQYLQRSHNGPSSPSPSLGVLPSISSSVNPNLAKLVSSQLLPCTCEARENPYFHQAASSDQSTSTWLSCDNVQLVNSHFYTTLPRVTLSQNQNSDHINSTSTSDANMGDSDKNSLAISRFSQRDAGLQTLHSQKFHYLQLSHLKSIDLSRNRIRQIKLDAFHGIELKLEHLDLSNNLLGDSRAVFDGDSSTHRVSNNFILSGNSEKLMFTSDELNRLGKLKWLSLHNNHISQLGPGIFIKTSGGSSDSNHHQDDSLIGMNELSYLDLSENLLRSVPGESIHHLNNLKKLNLNRNRIIQLDQSTKFPKSLESLDLSENLISSIRQCNLIDLPNLIEINLSNNQLSHLDKTAFLSAAASSLSLSNNLLLPVLASKGNSKLKRQETSNSVQSDSWSGNRAFLVRSGSASESESESEAEMKLSNIMRDETQGFVQEMPASDEYEDVSMTASKSRISKKRRRRRRRRSAGQLEVDESGTGMSSSLSPASGDNNDDDDVQRVDDDLVADESILSSIAYLVTGKQDTMNEDLNSVQQLNQFNSTLKLNLSYNFFENIPGDSLLKFSNLQQLDLSYNRIRRLDSNYLCSIYNLVENLRQLDLSGNLLSMMSQQQQQQQQQNSSTSGQFVEQESRQLNKLFGCLQKLEKLILSTNRLTVFEKVSRLSDLASNTLNESDGSYKLESDSLNGFAEEDNEENGNNLEGDDGRRGRLIIKFGEGFASKHLTSLDLSDNQLRSIPVIQYVGTSSNSPVQQHYSNGNSSNSSWIDSRICIEVLKLNHNYIERFNEDDFESIRNIRELHLDYNKLTALPVQQMRRFTSLDRLSLEGNRISSLSSLNKLLERTIRTLRVLNLANNRITEWPEISRQIISEAIASSSSSATANFVAYDLEGKSSQTQVGGGGASIGNSLSGSALAIQFALEELNLEGNLLTSSNTSSLFEQMIYMRSLRLLNLNHNLLTKIRSEWFKFANENLQILLLTGNRINNIDLGSFAGNQVNELRELHLNHNLLKELKRKTFDSMPKIRELNLANNLIHTINSEAFYQVNSLQILKLNNNKLSSWKCEYFSHLCNSISGTINADLVTLISSKSMLVSSLVELDLSHNSLSQLRANSIAVHTRLTRLDLSNNKLSFIPHDLFKATTSASSTGRQIQLVSSLRYLNLANNHIQTIDNVNTRPLKNLINLDLSFNELQTLGVDVVSSSSSPVVDGEILGGKNQTSKQQEKSHHRKAKSFTSSNLSWPALCKLRHLNLANNQLTLVNQSLLSELSPFVLLNLNLSNNYLESESLPQAFYSRVANVHKDYDLVFTLKLESLDLSHNRMNEFPTHLLDNHYTSMESCNLSHNRIQSLLADSNLMIQIKSLNLEFNPLNRESNELILFERRNVRSLNLAATRLFAIQQVSMSSSGSSGSNREYLSNQTSQLDLIRSISRQIDAPYLRHLNLSSNQLVWLAANVFDRMHSLQSLDLSNNQLTRLHLLNNQLLPISSSLHFLNIGSNLFTSIDQTDFTQLTSLRHLDLSNLLSLQRINCKFLSKLTTLTTLRMIHYPSLRQTINSLIIALNTNEASNQPYDRLRRKLRNELLLSTIGRHCFQEELHDNPSEIGFSSNIKNHSSLNSWFNLEELELEVFNDFSSTSRQQGKGGRFDMEDELSQLLGPKLKHLTLIGLNLTSLSENSLLGITNEELKLKISYTSLNQLPLKQILNSVAKSTRLDLDFRNNNIQSIDTINLQLFDELNDQVLQRSGHNPLKLSSNPIRCDCQARPLWLWLNQRWNSDGSEEQGSSFTFSENNTTLGYWLKFRSISQTSDLKCYYPLKLRGKLTSHVNYNDLVCKGTNSVSLTPSQATSGNLNQRQSRKRNETRSSDSYYIASLNNEGEQNSDSDAPPDEDEYNNPYADPNLRADVMETKFNRFRPSLSNYSLYFLNNNNIPPANDEYTSSGGEKEILFRSKTKRDRSSFNTNQQRVTLNQNEIADQQTLESINQQSVRPLILQSRQHLPFQSLNVLDHLTGRSRSITSRHSGGSTSGKHSSLLTDIDVIILTVMSITMAILSFIIISICLVKYKFDKTNEEEILDMHKKIVITRAMQLSAAKEEQDKILKLHHHRNQTTTNVKATNYNETQVKKSSKSSNSSSTDSNKQVLVEDTTVAAAAATSTKVKKCSSFRLAHKLAKRHVLVPIAQNAVLAPATENFLMRSPTIRRMHGLASNASDWFKFTLRTYPPHIQGRRRGLFISNQASQSTSSKLAPTSFQPQRCRLVADEMENEQPAKNERPPIAPKPMRIQTKPHQVRSMRTFGASNVSQQQQQQQQQNQIKINDNLHQKQQQVLGLSVAQSQIPSNDVEGRFAYQSDSQPDSRGGETPVSRTDDQQDVFILVQDDSSQRNSSRETPVGISYSHSSSPVAYGFMRNSPSIATVSSIAHNSNSNSNNNNNNNNNNNDMDYSVNVKQESIALVVGQEGQNNINSNNRWNLTSTTTDEQIIISRL